MQLNKQVLSFLRESESFQKKVALFTPGRVFYSWAKDIYSFVASLHPEYIIPQDCARNASNFNRWLDSYPEIEEGLAGEKRFMFFEQFVDTLQSSTQMRFRDLNAQMDAISLALYNRNPFFKPVIYTYHYDAFENDCRSLGIDLPEPPITKDYRNYFFFYYEICEVLNRFQQEHGLTDAELCAAIYGFEEKETISLDLPEPTNIWLIGGGSDFDLSRLDDTTDNTPTIWQGNERSRRGDLVVVYVLYPVSAIHSVWRVVKEGMFNPFDNYQNRIALSCGIKVPEIKLAELKEKFGYLQIVKKNMQGVNGVSLDTDDYKKMETIWVERGFDKSKLPVLTQPEEMDVDIKDEINDVYTKIVERIIPRLGYQEGEWQGGKRGQLRRQSGRKEAEIPDYVFFAHGDEVQPSAPLVIEAKFDFKNARQLRKDFNQGYSYAKALHSKYLGLCDKRELFIFEGKAGDFFNLDNPCFHRRWADIFSKDTVFMELKAIIGREVIKDLV